MHSMTCAKSRPSPSANGANGHQVIVKHWTDGSTSRKKTYIALGGPSVAREQFAEVEDVLFRYHTALPFDEAEREWLWQAYDAAWGPNSISIIRRREARVMSAGLRRVILGRDLMRRWWAWRRETDEYAGQGSLDAARESLRELIETVSPSLDLPEPYLTLRGQNPDGQPTG
jgi:hypothetical protein